MPERIPINEFTYRVRGGTPSTILTGSTDLEEVRGLIAHTYRVAPEHIEVRRNT